MKRSYAFAAGVVVLLATIGCTVSRTSSTAESMEIGVDAEAPVSFRSDVMPVFAFSCNFSSCHGKRRPDRVYLGPGSGAVDPDPSATAAEVRSALLGASQRADMPMVTPSRTDESFLIYKLDGDFSAIAHRCANGCGDSMPKGNDALAEAKRATIRRWIADGALDN